MSVHDHATAERLYYDAQQMLVFEAVVTDIRLESRRDAVNRWQVALDRTAFYPEGGGQPWDTGTLEAVARSGVRLEVPVLAVVEDDREIWHIVEKPLTAGTPITGRIDGARRRDHMQQHTGQHLLSAVFLRELGAPTVSFHLGAESSTIDLAVDLLPPEALIAVEEAVNQTIADNCSVTTSTVQRQQAEEMLARGDLRKLPERLGPIRLVEIEGVEWNACGGTHVASTGAIGGLTIRSLERVRQGIRVEFCCGLRVVRSARRDNESVRELGRMLSTGAEELPGKVSAMLEDARTSSKTHRSLLEEMAALEAQTLVARPETILQAHARDLQYAKLLAARCVALRPAAVALIDTSIGWQSTLVLASGSTSGIDCGAIMKAALNSFGAKGGGSAGLAQGSIAADRLNDIIAFIRANLP